MKTFLTFLAVMLCSATAYSQMRGASEHDGEVALADDPSGAFEHASGSSAEHDSGEHGLQEEVDPTLEHDDELAHPSHHWSGAIGTKAISAVAIEEGETLALGGVGGLVEYGFFNHQLDVEIAAAWLTSAALTEVPVDVVFKHPFHLSRKVDLFVGAGPMLVFATHHHGGEHAHDERTLYTGGIVSVGSYIWSEGHFGLILEADYALVTADHKPAHEFEAGAGVMYRF